MRTSCAAHCRRNTSLSVDNSPMSSRSVRSSGSRAASACRSAALARRHRGRLQRHPRCDPSPTGVPIGAHAREDSHLLAAQTGDPAPPARGKAHLAWGDLGASGGEEVPDLGAAVHASTIRAGDHAKGVELVPPTSSAFLATVSGGEVGNDAGTPNALKSPPCTTKPSRLLTTAHP